MEPPAWPMGADTGDPPTALQLPTAHSRASDAVVSHGSGSSPNPGPRLGEQMVQHHPLRQTTFGRPDVEPTTTPPRFPPTTPPGRLWGMAMRPPNVDAAEAQPRAPALNGRFCTDEGDPHADNGAPS